MLAHIVALFVSAVHATDKRYFFNSKSILSLSKLFAPKITRTMASGNGNNDLQWKVRKLFQLPPSWTRDCFVFLEIQFRLVMRNNIYIDHMTKLRQVIGSNNCVPKCVVLKAHSGQFYTRNNISS